MTTINGKVITDIISPADTIRRLLAGGQVVAATSEISALAWREPTARLGIANIGASLLAPIKGISA